MLPHERYLSTARDGYYCLRDLEPGPVKIVAEVDGQVGQRTVD